GVSLLLFDNGNARAAIDATAHSRGQLFQIDESNRVAKLVFNADVGSYSAAVGSAQLLPNGNYHFDSGFIIDSSGTLTSQSVEVSPSGQILYNIGFGAIDYRSFRMPDLYTAP